VRRSKANNVSIQAGRIFTQVVPLPKSSNDRFADWINNHIIQVERFRQGAGHPMTVFYAKRVGISGGNFPEEVHNRFRPGESLK